MPHTESDAAHEAPRHSRAWLLVCNLIVGIAVVFGLGIAVLFAYVILGPMLGVEAY